MNNKLKLIANYFGKDRVKFEERVAEYTVLKVGGPAKLFFIAFTTQELIKIIKVCRELKVPNFVFGTGSKTMLSENGFDGVVIKNRTKNIQVLSIKGKVSKFGIGIEEAMVEVDSGVSISKLIEFLDGQGLRSLGFESITGSVGGALFLSPTLQSNVKSIKVLDSGFEIEEIESRDLSLKKHIILSAVFKIKSK